MNLPIPSAPAVVKGVVNTYNNATKGLQNVGKQIATNEAQGSSNFQSGKMPYYGSINPLQGTGTAFRTAFKKGQVMKKSARIATPEYKR